MKKTEKELRKLKRSDLLELMLVQSEEIDRLREELDRTKQQLEEKTVHIQQAGSIAEAAVQISGLLNAAQEAADIYLLSIKQTHGQEKGD